MHVVTKVKGMGYIQCTRNVYTLNMLSTRVKSQVISILCYRG